MNFRTAPLSLTLIALLYIWAPSSRAQEKPANNHNPVQKITFNDLAKLVSEKNETVESSKKLIQAQEERTGSLTRSFLPQISVQAGTEKFKSGDTDYDQQNYWKAEATINLYRGGKDLLESDLRSASLERSKLTHTSTYQNELNQAKKSFWQALALDQLIKETKEALDKNETNIKSAQRRVGAGITTAADVTQFELFKTTLQRHIKKLELEYDLARNKLSVALGLDEHENLEIVGNFPSVNDTQFSDFNINNQIDIKTQKSSIKMEELRAKQESHWWLPSIDAYANYGLPSLSEDSEKALNKEKEQTIGLKLTLDFGKGFESSAEATARKLEVDAAQSALRQKTREIIATQHELIHDLKVMHELVGYADQDIQQASKFLNLTNSEYNRGVKNGPDLLEAYQKYYELRSKKIEYNQKYFETLAELEALTAESQIK